MDPPQQEHNDTNNTEVSNGNNLKTKSRHNYTRHPDFNIFDVVAGRINKKYRSNRGVYKRVINGAVQPALSPDEYILSRHSNVEIYPYVEHPLLPDSNLVTAINYYMSKKIERMGNDGIYEQYDSTAILAIAIEIEEKIKEMLGPDGHLFYAREKKEDAI